MSPSLMPLIGSLLEGPTLADEQLSAAGQVGRPVWDMRTFLADLENRLGLGGWSTSVTMRVQLLAKRMRELESAKSGRFYARSFELDQLGAATALLRWRDELVISGWNGEEIPDGGERLATLRELWAGADLPPGFPDRLRRVEEEFRSSRTRLYDALQIAESRELLPSRWQRVLGLLEECGTEIRQEQISLPGRQDDSDLGRLQMLLRGDKRQCGALRRDGTLIVLRAESSWELGDAVAALLRGWSESSMAIVRGGDLRALDVALTRQGLASQGVEATSSWRPALQVLPLAVELAFEPRDPARVLELLTLPHGPFGFDGAILANALAKAPGIGGPQWRRAKEQIATITRAHELAHAEREGLAREDAARTADTLVEKRLARIAEWLETPAPLASQGAPRAMLRRVGERVRAWLQRRLVMAGEAAGLTPTDRQLAARATILATAFARAEAFHEALSYETRETLDLVEARLLVEEVSGGGHALSLAEEEAGRIDHAASPANVRYSRDVVVWWHCVSSSAWRPPVPPWRRAELAALRGAGIFLSDPSQRLAAESRTWQHVVHAARSRLVLAIPRWERGNLAEPHPIYQEIAGRLGAGPDLVGVTLEARNLLGGYVSPLVSQSLPALVELGPIHLPSARDEWRLDPALLHAPAVHTATSLDELLGCPLQWVLKNGTNLRAGTLASIPKAQQLNGIVGHRLVEELHRAGAMDKLDTLEHAIATRLDSIVREEAAVLLRPGMTFELTQLKRQLERSIVRLAEVLAHSNLTVAGVEKDVETEWRAGKLRGRLDVLLCAEDGRKIVLDLKWGRKAYKDRLEQGLATQLAVYVAALRGATAGALPHAAFFSLSRGEILATREVQFSGVAATAGPAIQETLARLERTVERIEAILMVGRVPVTGVKGALPLLRVLGVDEAEDSAYLQRIPGDACEYCSYGALCGRSWETLP
jgi:ATP-dependent helicase/nuclease subunit B